MNSEIGILSLLSIVIDCKIVERPPKDITKVQAKIVLLKERLLDISMHPFVISIKPSSTPDSGAGKRLNSGVSEWIITKNIAMIVPTEIILIALSVTISPILNSGFVV